MSDRKTYEEKESYVTRNSNPSDWKQHANYKIMEEHSHLFKNSVCADLGCNHGACTLLAHDFEPLWIDGYDINRNALKTARETTTAMGVTKNTRFVPTNLKQIPVDSDSYDTIMTFHTLEHIYPDDVKEVVQEMFRILKAGGHVLISIPYKDNYGDPCHVAFYDENTLRVLFEDCGFVTLTCMEDNRWAEKGLLTALFRKP